MEEFKSALGMFASGVTVVTARDVDDGNGAAGGPADFEVGGEDVAMTATAFVSVSLTPPLVLVSVGEGARMYDLLVRRDMWAVSILNEDQAHVSSRFAIQGRVSDRLLFEDLPRHRGPATGAVILDGETVRVREMDSGEQQELDLAAALELLRGASDDEDEED